MLYAEVILPLALNRLYHYCINEEALSSQKKPQIGCRVVVSFGSKRFYTGIIYSLNEKAPVGIPTSKLKPIEAILDNEPLIGKTTFDLWIWMSSYYHCSIGQVLRAALPSGLLPESQTIVFLTPNWEATTTLSPKEMAILDTLSTAPNTGISLNQLMRSVNFPIARHFDHLYTMGAVRTEEVVTSRYKPKMKAYIGLTKPYQSVNGLADAEIRLSRAPKQLELLSEWLRLSEEECIGISGLIARSRLSSQQASTNTLIRHLVEKGIFRMEMLPESRIETKQVSSNHHATPTSFPPKLPIKKSVSLLYTATSRAREEQIVAQVAHYICKGKQVLMLSPSASSLPSQRHFLDCLQHACSGQIFYYHPLTSESKRTELFLRLSQNNSPCLILGTRQAIFLPLSNLGLIIVDEEQEYLYKQQHTAPLYHSRDVALWLGSKINVPVLLVSETPSCETLFNVFRGKYELLVPEQEASRLSPAVNIQSIDLSYEKSLGKMPYGTSISLPLKNAIEHTLHQGKRVLLLQNRRGYAPFAICDACGERIICSRCAVSLTYHQSKRRLICHYCGKEDILPNRCPHCKESHIWYSNQQKPAIKLIGYGIERVEQEVKNLFPDEQTIRIDSESLQSNKRIQELHNQITHNDAKIIIGTQLIKGQPIWEDIGLIGVIQLDTILGYPDFRAEERTYQLLMQLLIKSTEFANQREDGNMIHLILQTNNSEHPFIGSLRLRDYKGFIKAQLSERHLLRFAPFWRMTYIQLRSSSEELVEEVAQTFYCILNNILGQERISEVQTPSVARIDNYYIREIVCRRPYSETYHTERQQWREAQYELLHSLPQASKVKITFDVDPL